MTSKKNVKSSGIVRVTEAILATGTIIAALLIGVNLARQQSPFSTRFALNLENVGYDTLNTFTRENVMDKAMFDTDGNLLSSPQWEQNLKITLQGVLPKNLIYKLEVYNMSYNRSNDTIIPVMLNNIDISNAQSENDFIETGKVAVAIRTYNCKKYWVLFLRLSLVEGGSR